MKVVRSTCNYCSIACNFDFHVNEKNMLQEAMRRFLAAFAYSKKPVDPPKLVYGLVDAQGLHEE